MKRLYFRLMISLLAAGLSGPTLAKDAGDVFVETFSEFDQPFPPCQGLPANGVLYSYSIQGEESGDCRVFVLPGFVDPGPNVIGQLIDANVAGQLHLVFDNPTKVFGFGILLNSLEDHTVTVDLFRKNGKVKTEIFTTSPTQSSTLSTGQFDYHKGQPLMPSPSASVVKVTFCVTRSTT